MFLEDSRRRKLPELVAHHVFGNKYRVKNFPVVNEERVSHEIRNDCGAARPCFDRLLASGACDFVDLLEQVLLNKWSFFKAASHKLKCGFLRGVLTLDDEPVARLVLATSLKALCELAPR